MTEEREDKPMKKSEGERFLIAFIYFYAWKWKEKEIPTEPLLTKFPFLHDICQHLSSNWSLDELRKCVNKCKRLWKFLSKNRKVFDSFVQLDEIKKVIEDTFSPPKFEVGQICLHRFSKTPFIVLSPNYRPILSTTHGKTCLVCSTHLKKTYLFSETEIFPIPSDP